MPTAAELRAILWTQYPEDFPTWEKDFLETPYPHYFGLLEVDPDSLTVDDDIEQHYRRLIQAVHPDRNPGPEAAATAAVLNRARDTLKNKHLRRGYRLFLQFLTLVAEEVVAAEVAEEIAKQQREGESAGARDAGASAPPRLEIQPQRFAPAEPLAVGRTYEITLQVRNVGGPCSPALFRVRTPRHASHPRHEGMHWLSLVREPEGAPGRAWLTVPLRVDTRGLRPEQQYTAEIFIDLGGQELTCPVSFRTVRRRSSGPRPGGEPGATAVPISGGITLLRRTLVGRAVAAVALVVVGGGLLYALYAVAGRGSLTPSTTRTQANAVVAATEPTTAAAPPTVEAAQTAPAVSTAAASTASPSPTASPTPTPTPSPAPAPGAVLYQADWSSGRGEWTGGSDWKTVNGMLVNDGTGHGESVLLAPFRTSADNYAIEASIQLISGGDSRGIVFRHSTAAGHDQHYFAGSDRGRGAEFADEGNNPFASQDFSPGTDAHLYRVEVRGSSYTLSIDGLLVLEAQDSRYATGAQLGLWDGGGAQLTVKNFTVTALAPASPPPAAAAAAPGAVLYQADWSSGRGAWLGGTDWKTVNGMLVNDGTGGGESVLLAPVSAPADNYAIEADIQLISDGYSRGIVFRHSSVNGQYHHYFGGSDRERGAQFADEGNNPFATKSFSVGRTDHRYRVEVRGNDYKLYIDGTLLLDNQDNRYLTGVGVGLWDGGGAQLNVRSFRIVAL